MPVSWEHQQQVALFNWAAIQKAQYPELGLMYANPNGGKRARVTAARLKQEGVKAGIPDVFLPIARGGYHGYYIELKVIYPSGERNTLSDSQVEWCHKLIDQGYKVDVFWEWQDAAESIMNYLEG